MTPKKDAGRQAADSKPGLDQPQDLARPNRAIMRDELAHPK